VKSTIRPVAAVCLAVLAIAGCGTGGAGGGSSSVSASVSRAIPSSGNATTPAASTTTAAKADSAASRCGARKNASGDIYVRMKTPGTATVAQQLGGEWVWNVTLGKCLTSVQMMIATAPQVPGSCTWVGYVADNPSYAVNATPAPPLRNVVIAAGPAC
jgi:hypothetical protein